MIFVHTLTNNDLTDEKKQEKNTPAFQHCTLNVHYIVPPVIFLKTEER